MTNPSMLSRRRLLQASLATVLVASGARHARPAESKQSQRSRRAGRVRLDGNCLVDDNGPFLGLGASYFTSLWRCKFDRERLESDLSFLAGQGFNYYRMLSMVGYFPGWKGREIAPIDFTSRDDRRIEAWPDYGQQLRRLIDLAYDKHGLRTQITIFADAQLMPDRKARIGHMQKLLDDVIRGREQKIILLEVANEAWQNGFPGDQGVADLREFARYLADRTDIPIAITSNHNVGDGFEKTYANSAADIATWHFSRDRRTDDGWNPVYDCWELAGRKGGPPISSNEPIGPGSSVNIEKDPLKLVMAAAFAWAAGAPMYVFHSGAGVFGATRFEEMPGIDRYQALLRLLPPDLPNWRRNDGKGEEAPFTVFAGGEGNRYWPELKDPAAAKDGCVRSTGARKDNRFMCLPIGIRPDGLKLQARRRLKLTVHHPLTGQSIQSNDLARGATLTLPPGPGALILTGQILRER